ncbi:MAG TPA: hypothetical protein VFE58_00105 [Tepidisphaeraceae bacterium]|jgi:hypothetical protein|nr:hypothetical protein [Tepidisphaeraceae bacterium]
MKNRLGLLVLVLSIFVALTDHTASAVQLQRLTDSGIASADLVVRNPYSTLADVGFENDWTGKLEPWAAVCVFKLPAKSSDQKVSSASFTVSMTRTASDGYQPYGVTPTFNGDLYALSPRSTPQVLTSDYYGGAYGGDSTALGVQDNFLTPTVVTRNFIYPSIVSTGLTADATLVQYLNDAYDNGSGQYVFLRLSPDSVTNMVDTSGYFGLFEKQPSAAILTITFVPEPGFGGWLLVLFGVGLMRWRRAKLV